MGSDVEEEVTLEKALGIELPKFTGTKREVFLLGRDELEKTPIVPHDERRRRAWREYNRRKYADADKRLIILARNEANRRKRRKKGEYTSGDNSKG